MRSRYVIWNLYTYEQLPRESVLVNTHLADLLAPDSIRGW